MIVFVKRVFCIVLLSVLPSVVVAQNQPPNELASQYRFFQFVVQDQPDNRPAKFRLAQVAFQLGRIREARWHLDQLIVSSTSEDELETLKAARSEVIERKPVFTQLRFALMPSTNIANNSSETTFSTTFGDLTITGGGDEESGIGLRLGLGAVYEFTNQANDVFRLSGNFDYIGYRGRELDRRVLGTSMMWSRSSIGFTTSMQAYINKVDYLYFDRDQNDLVQTGLALSRRYFLSDKDSLNASFQYEQREYPSNPVQNGPFSKVNLSYSRVLSEKWQLFFDASLERSVPELESFAYDGWQLGAGVSYALTRRESLGFEYSYLWRDYASDFSGLSFARTDKVDRFGVSFVTSRIRIFESVPRLTCTFTDQKSNVALYTYNATDCQIVFQRRF